MNKWFAAAVALGLLVGGVIGHYFFDEFIPWIHDALEGTDLDANLEVVVELLIALIPIMIVMSIMGYVMRIMGLGGPRRREHRMSDVVEEPMDLEEPEEPPLCPNCKLEPIDEEDEVEWGLCSRCKEDPGWWHEVLDAYEELLETEEVER